MEKIIKLKMDKTKTLHILLNGSEKHKIPVNNRSITAEKIYELIDFSVDDHYTIQKENEGDVDIDKPVMDCFCDLFTDIITKVNKLSSKDK
jgi:hypothetical protein